MIKIPGKGNKEQNITIKYQHRVEIRIPVVHAPSKRQFIFDILGEDRKIIINGIFNPSPVSKTKMISRILCNIGKYFSITEGRIKAEEIL